jgi:hypothetical protein
MTHTLFATTDPTSLDNLIDIVSPAPVPWWPPAPGWFVVAGVLAIVAIATLVVYVLRWKGNAYRREALRELEAIVRESAGDPQRLADLPELVKRTALAAWPREIVAGLTGEQWLHFLDQTGRTADFTNGPGTELPDLAYIPQRATKLDPTRRQDMIKAIRRWIERHDSSLQSSGDRSPC